MVATLTDVMGFVKYNDRILRDIFRNLFRHFRVEEVMERIDHNVNECHLSHVQQHKCNEEESGSPYGEQ
jgi:hypothetical protein